MIELILLILAAAGMADAEIRQRNIEEDEDEDESEFEPADYINFRGGDCYLMALVLHRETGLPIHGLFKSGHPGVEHAFVFNPATEEVIDADGRRPLTEAFNRYYGDTTRALTPAEIEAFPGYDEDEWDYAMSCIP